MTLFVFFCVPETRNVPIEVLTEESFGKHFLWSRFAVSSNRHSSEGGDARAVINIAGRAANKDTDVV
jgi:hypothetical protein